MSEDGHDHPAARYRAMVFSGPEARTSAEQSVTAAMNATFGSRRYTTTEGWVVGGREGNGDVNTDGPDKSPAWRQRIEKARREIAEHKLHIEWIDTVDAAHREWPSESVSELRAFISGVM